jgi:nucleotide-diphospho-sugar transferase
MMNSALADAGYDFVFTDGDVFLTGNKDPFTDMLPLSDPSWDIQFQQDNKLDNKDGDHYNIGWYFARATPATQEYFRNSFLRWIAWETKPSDQNAMNAAAREMLPEHKMFKNGTVLRLHLLEYSSFHNVMLDGWDWFFFGNEPFLEKYLSNATMLHFTCIQGNLKTYFGLNFGGFVDLDGYYSSPRSLLRMVNISGTKEAIHSQVALAIKLASEMGRTVIWPDAVDVFQLIEDKNVDYRYRTRFPGVTSVDFVQAEKAGYSVVEGRYLFNREALGFRALQEYQIPVKNQTSDAGIDALKRAVEQISLNEVVVLDFDELGVDWSKLKLTEDEIKQPDFTKRVKAAAKEFKHNFQHMGMDSYAREVQEQVPLCKRIDSNILALTIC